MIGKAAAKGTLSAIGIAALAAAAPGHAQETAESCVQGGFLAAPPSYQSAQVHADGRVTFRICAPEAHSVMVTSADAETVIPMPFAPPGGLTMAKDPAGLWSVTTPAAFAPDTYRFRFKVDGVAVPDPRGQTFSNERFGLSSTLEVPGPEGAFQTYDPAIPHGVVSRIEYWSAALGQKRMAMVYTPPGYMTGTGTYPVLYLVHGAGDHFDSWTSVGKANHILDNLIAAGAAQPMIVVMPFGHTPERPGSNMLANSDFGDDLTGSLIPFVDADFRTIDDADHRAMAGLSMGGAHTLNFGLPRSDLFHYIGIFSMGLGAASPDAAQKYAQDNQAGLAQSANAMKLVYYAMGSQDFLYATAAPTREVMDKAGIDYIYNESGGGHTWINWRQYLADFAPRLFIAD